MFTTEFMVKTYFCTVRLNILTKRHDNSCQIENRMHSFFIHYFLMDYKPKPYRDKTHQFKTHHRIEMLFIERSILKLFSTRIFSKMKWHQYIKQLLKCINPEKKMFYVRP